MVLITVAKLCFQLTPDVQVTYGCHMAVHMALGLLFLGGGAASLDTSNESIAALVAAFYPILPMNSADNRYHLQVLKVSISQGGSVHLAHAHARARAHSVYFSIALSLNLQPLRHLYVLASRPRALVPVDVETHMPEFCPLLLTLNPLPGCPAETLRVMAPCLLPPLDRIASIKVSGPRHWPTVLSASATGLPGMVLVKRRAGHARYNRSALAALAAQCSAVWGCPCASSVRSDKKPADILDVDQAPGPAAAGLHGGLLLERSLASDPWAVSFATLLGGVAALPAAGPAATAQSLGGPLASFAMAALHECLSHERVDMLLPLLAVHACVALLDVPTVDCDTATSLTVQCRFALDFFDKGVQRMGLPQASSLLTRFYHTTILTN